MRSVFCDHRAAERVVHADGAHVDILTNIVDTGQTARRRASEGEAVVAIAHEQVVVFKGNRPARRKTDLDAGADRAAPTGFAGGVERSAENVAVVLVMGDCGTALAVPE